MEQLAQMTATMNYIQAQLKTLSADSTNSTIPKRNITIGSVREISIVGLKHPLKINQDTNMRPTTRKNLGSDKRGVDDGQVQL